MKEKSTRPRVEPTVRRATADDGDAFVALVRGLAAYEKLEPPSAEGERRLRADAFGDEPRIEVILAESGSSAIGYAIFFETYSSFLALPTLYLEDLFVTPEARGSGAGKALMRWLAREAVRRGCGRLEWVVLDWNRLALDFYDRLGATRLEEWVPYRLAGDALSRFGEEP